mgnify:CR=1 FL=1|jgi:predicted methyltransferase
MRYRPLTGVAQQALSGIMHAGDLAIDATVGNGHDLLFLAQQVGAQGQVMGFDVQAIALQQARARIAEEGLADEVSLRLCGHEHMLAALPADWPGKVAAVMFNLGYLPGFDKSLVTRAETTVVALSQALSVLRAGGLISLLAYRGHPGGGAEVAAIDAWLAQRGDECRVIRHDSPGPILYLVERLVQHAEKPVSHQDAAAEI